MPRIPIQSLVSSRESGVDVQPGAFQATAQATANLMSSVSGAAQMVKQQFDRAQDLRNRTQLSEERRGLRDARGNFLNKMNGVSEDGSKVKPTPPAQWGHLWKTELEAIKKGFKDSDMPPVVSRALNEEYENFAGSSYIQIAGAALKLNQRESRQNFDRELQHFVTEENWEEAGGLVKNARGYEITDGEADGLNKALGVGKRNADMATSVEKNPKGHIKKVEEDAFGRLAPSQKRKEIKKGELGMTKLEVEGVTFLQDMLEDGNYKDEGEFEVAIDEIPHITPRTKKRLLKNYKSSAPISKKELFYLQDKIDDLTKLQGNPEEYEAAWNDLKVELGTYRREDVGRFNTVMSLEAPHRYSKEANAKRTEKERQELSEPLLKRVRQHVKTLSDAQGKLLTHDQILPVRPSDMSGTAETKRRRNIEIEKDIELKTEKARYAVQTAADRFIMDAPHGAPRTFTEVEKYLKENQTQIMRKAVGVGEVNVEDAVSGSIEAYERQMGPGVGPGMLPAESKK